MSEGPMFFESYEDAAEYQRRIHDQRLMNMEAFSNGWRSLIVDELTTDQLEVVSAVLSIVADSPDSCALANYYQGQVVMAHHMRNRVKLDSAALTHEFSNSEDLDNPYCGDCGLPPANSVHRT